MHNYPWRSVLPVPVSSPTVLNGEESSLCNEELWFGSFVSLCGAGFWRASLEIVDTSLLTMWVCNFEYTIRTLLMINTKAVRPHHSYWHRIKNNSPNSNRTKPSSIHLFLKCGKTWGRKWRHCWHVLVLAFLKFVLMWEDKEGIIRRTTQWNYDYKRTGAPIASNRSSIGSIGRLSNQSSFVNFNLRGYCSEK